MAPRLVTAASVAMPFIFVILWSTGFIGARLTMPFAEPMTFLTLRFIAAAAIMAILSLVLGVGFRFDRTSLLHAAVAGLLLHATYLGGVFIAVRMGVEAGASALIVGAQPVLTAAFAGLALGEVITPRKWIGLLLGGGGIVVFITEKLGQGVGSLEGVLFCVLALIGISVGTVYQKRYVNGVSIIPGAALQYAVAAVACGALSLLFETGEIEWSASFVFGFVWLTLVLSIGAVSLLYLLIRRGGAANVASLFFLVPPCAALIAWPLFGETMGVQAMIGMSLVASGVLLVNTKSRFARWRAPL